MQIIQHIASGIDTFNFTESKLIEKILNTNEQTHDVILLFKKIIGYLKEYKAFLPQVILKKKKRKKTTKKLSKRQLKKIKSKTENVYKKIPSIEITPSGTGGIKLSPIKKRNKVFPNIIISEPDSNNISNESGTESPSIDSESNDPEVVKELFTKKFSLGYNKKSGSIVCLILNEKDDKIEKRGDDYEICIFSKVIDLLEKKCTKYHGNIISISSTKKIYISFVNSISAYRFTFDSSLAFKELFFKENFHYYIGFGISTGNYLHGFIGNEKRKYERFKGNTKVISQILSEYSLENNLEIIIDLSTKKNLERVYKIQRIDYIFISKVNKYVKVYYINPSDYHRRMTVRSAEHAFLMKQEITEKKNEIKEIWDHFEKDEIEECLNKLENYIKKKPNVNTLPYIKRLFDIVKMLKQRNLTIEELAKKEVHRNYLSFGNLKLTHNDN